MPDPIPTDTPARLALVELLERALGPRSVLARDARTASSEDDAAALAAWLDEVLLSHADAAVFRAASDEIHETLRARGLIVTARGKLARIVDDDERERGCALSRAAGPDPDAGHDDHERGGR